MEAAGEPFRPRPLGPARPRLAFGQSGLQAAPDADGSFRGKRISSRSSSATPPDGRGREVRKGRWRPEHQGGRGIKEIGTNGRHHPRPRPACTTFIPIDREDIHRLITRMDDVMDFVESASERIALYELREMTPEARELADVLVRATETLVIAVGGLRDLKKTQVILDACIEVNRLENEGDEILRNAVATLFREATDPLLVMKWKEVYEALENATDRCEDVANIIEGVVLEHA
jgi:hypothetical protein